MRKPRPHVTDCTSSITFELHVALLLGKLSNEQAAAVEDHVLACSVCAVRSDRISGLIGGVREIVPPVISHAERHHLELAGVRIRLTSVEPNEKARARFTPDTDILVLELCADLSHAEQTDLQIMTASGESFVLLERIPFDEGSVLVTVHRDYQFVFAGEAPFFRIHITEAGERRFVGSYFIELTWT